MGVVIRMVMCRCGVGDNVVEFRFADSFWGSFWRWGMRLLLFRVRTCSDVRLRLRGRRRRLCLGLCHRRGVMCWSSKWWMRIINSSNNQRTRRDGRMRVPRLSDILLAIKATRQSKVHTTKLRCRNYRLTATTTTATTTTAAAAGCCRWIDSTGRRGVLDREEGIDMVPGLDNGDDEEDDDYQDKEEVENWSPWQFLFLRLCLHC